MGFARAAKAEIWPAQVVLRALVMYSKESAEVSPHCPLGPFKAVQKHLAVDPVTLVTHWVSLTQAVPMVAGFSHFELTHWSPGTQSAVVWQTPARATEYLRTQTDAMQVSGEAGKVATPVDDPTEPAQVPTKLLYEAAPEQASPSLA